MRTVRLLADDLTGAIDSAVRLLPLAGEIPVLWSPGVVSGSLALDLGTREADSGVAGECAARSAGLLREADLAYLKCDSLLRGNAAAEIIGCLRASGIGRCIVAPAFPAQHRITRGGRQLMRQPDGAWGPVGANLPAALRALGCEVALREPGDSVPDGVSFWDAESDTDLAAIVRAGREGPAPLWCGSAGLAGALAGVPAPAMRRQRRPFLALLGSDHPVTVGQLDRAADWHQPVVAEDPEVPRRIAARLAEQGAVAVTVALPVGLGRAEAARRIAACFARLLVLPAPGTLFATGGETLRAICKAAGARALSVQGEIAPGVPASRMVGGAWDGAMVVSKSGAFGEPDLLRNLMLSARE